MTSDITSAKSCQRCILSETRISAVLPSPCSPGGLLAIGEAPGAEEDAEGVGFIGRAGKTLDYLLMVQGYRRGIEYGVTNVVWCRPPKNRKPKIKEIARCAAYLGEAIATIQPRVLLLVGATATNAILGKGSLFEHVKKSRQATHCDFSRSQPELREYLRGAHPEVYSQGIAAIPMPHTSGLAWINKAPDGERWSIIGAEQVALAVSVCRLKQTTLDF